MQLIKAPTGKVVHSTGTECKHNVSKNPMEVGEEELALVLAAGGKFCPDTLAALDRAKADHFHSPATPEQPKKDGLLEAHLDQLAARMEKLAKRRKARKALRDEERAKKLGLEPGDRIERTLPNRGHKRYQIGTNAKANGRIMGRPAARRKAQASIWTHRAHIDPDGLMFVWRIGTEPSSTARPARPRDRARIGVRVVAGR